MTNRFTSYQLEYSNKYFVSLRINWNISNL